MFYDAIIIGGSFAGLSAALYLGRARRSVLVLDTGAPRNRFAVASHGFFAQDGSDPKTMLDTMRGQVAAYPTVQFQNRKALDVVQRDGAFQVMLETGETAAAARLLLAFGVSDILPSLPGIAERWGKTVIHCPYCHGYEFSGLRLGVLNLSPMSVHQASLIPEWGPTTFFMNGGTLEAGEASMLEQRGVVIEPSPVERLVGNGTALSAVRLGDGNEFAVDALFIAPPNSLSSDIAERLGCSMEQGPLGSVISVNEMKATSIEGVYAAGDATRMAATVTFACADGVMAALAIHRSLVFGGE
ncbi:thioredoxin reductase [Ochrobactrum sp. 19YEA23]|uniref:NAD(P)/FAD-dependent oxidoreductase n=1 Tax=Ochrobactrum sp. 19YEA23 TaxID=3039854 RepID=UPI0024795583|nr:thioredoxin reductase [Ochrobactrum sp. 19YEA23]